MYVLKKSDFWSDIELYRSINNGEIWVQVTSFGTNDFNRFRLLKAHNSDLVYMLRKGGNETLILSQIIGTQIQTVNDTGIDIADERVNFAATVFNNDTIMYTHDKDMVIHASTDAGVTWEERDAIPTTPWAVGIYVLKSNPDILYTGDINGYTTTDGGNSWTKLGDWWEYYDDVEYSIHADMMQFNEYQTAAGDNFLLISNDGGVSINNDDYFNLSQGYRNIGMTNLNISQYYDVRSDLDPSHYYIYAGAQDQGFQRAFTNFSNEGTLEFDQVISGDYGHIAFSRNGDRMWAVYPGGWITHYFDPENGNVASSYDIESDNESSIWIPPTMDAPNMDDNIIYVAGGSADGGSGSYLIKLEATPNGSDITATNMPFNFTTALSGQPSALASSNFDNDRFYVATTTGDFFTSNDAAQTWTQATQEIPDGHYLYGQTILPSKVDTETVYLGGSGYSNPAVLKSVDGGNTFTEMIDSLPPTLVFDLATNADESLIFAATEAGPYVFVTAENRWYDMAGMYAPAQTYWSVEFLEEDNIARFATYGRGIWDFQIKDVVSTNNISKTQFAFKAFPNPSNGIINLEWNDLESSNVNAQLYDVSGKLILRKSFDSNPNALNTHTLDLSKLSSGNYFIKIETEEKLGTEKIILQK